MEKRWYVYLDSAGVLGVTFFSKFHPAVPSVVPVSESEDPRVHEAIKIIAAFESADFDWVEKMYADESSLKVLLGTLRAGMRAQAQLTSPNVFSRFYRCILTGDDGEPHQVRPPHEPDPERV